MKIRIVAPIVGDWFIDVSIKEGCLFASADTELDATGIKKGPTSIESAYDEVLANPYIVDEVLQAEKDGCDGVFITCFGDPAVDAAREMVSIPVVGGFAPSALMASALAGKWSIVTILREVMPLIQNLTRKHGLESNLASVRVIDIPVLELDDEERLRNRTLEESLKAIREDGAECIVLGCTGMLGLGQFLKDGFSAEGLNVPVVEPTAAAIGFLESMIRSGVSHSKLTYPTPREKDRIV